MHALTLLPGYLWAIAWLVNRAGGIDRMRLPGLAKATAKRVPSCTAKAVVTY